MNSHWLSATQTNQSIDEAALQRLVESAILAPSSHNTQPWRFRISQGCIDLIADRTRALPVNDPYDRELTISCGAALFNLRLAAAGQGLDATVQYLPVPEDPDLLARVGFQGSSRAQIGDAAELIPELPRRRTYRKRFAAEDISPTVIARLDAAASFEGARFATVDSRQLREAAKDLVTRGDQLLWEDIHWRRELSAWMHPRRRGDGFVIPGLAHAASQLIARSFDMGGGVAARDAQLLDGSPLLLLLGSAADTVIDWLRTGQALQRVLLTACAAGLQASFLNQPIHLPEQRQLLADLVPVVGLPQILLRLGRPTEELAPVARLPLQQVLDIDWDIP